MCIYTCLSQYLTVRKKRFMLELDEIISMKWTWFSLKKRFIENFDRRNCVL